MDQQQEDVVIGRTLRRHRDTRNKLDCLVAEAHELGRLFDRTARVLSQVKATEILACGENLIRELELDETMRAGVDGEKLMSLFREIQQTYKEFERYSSDLKSFQV